MPHLAFISKERFFSAMTPEDTTEGRRIAVGSQEAQAVEMQRREELQRRANMAAALLRSVRERMQGKSSLDFPAIVQSVLNRKLSEDDLTKLGFKSEADPEELIKQLWYALVFEAYFAGHPSATIPVHLLPAPETPNCCLWNAVNR